MTQDKPTDMTAEEFFNGLFNLDFMSEEEKQTIYKGAELFAKGKVQQASLNRQGWTSDEEQEKLWNEAALILFDQHNPFTKIESEIGQRLLRGFVKDLQILKSKYKLIPHGK